MAGPAPRVLDLFAVPDAVRPLDGDVGTGQVVAGDLVLSPHHDPAVTAWLSPHLARLAVQRDERPERSPRDLRVAVPVPARDGSWVVDGWAANRWEPGTVACAEPGVVRAAGRLLHALTAGRWAEEPDVLAERDDHATLVEREVLDDPTPGPGARLVPQLVHTRLWGHVLLDDAGAPVVTHVRPTWRPAAWADVLCAVDAVAGGAEASVLEDAGRGAAPRATRDLVRAAVRLRRATEPEASGGQAEAYGRVVDALDLVGATGDGGPRSTSRR